jgi:hypothetical protein
MFFIRSSSRLDIVTHNMLAQLKDLCYCVIGIFCVKPVTFGIMLKFGSLSQLMFKNTIGEKTEQSTKDFALAWLT